MLRPLVVLTLAGALISARADSLAQFPPTALSGARTEHRSGGPSKTTRRLRRRSVQQFRFIREIGAGAW
jgi:hypothetical protein